MLGQRVSAARVECDGAGLQQSVLLQSVGCLTRKMRRSGKNGFHARRQEDRRAKRAGVPIPHLLHLHVEHGAPESGQTVARVLILSLAATDRKSTPSRRVRLAMETSFTLTPADHGRRVASQPIRSHNASMGAL